MKQERYQRRTQPVKYLGTTRSVSHVMSLITRRRWRWSMLSGPQEVEFYLAWGDPFVSGKLV